MENEGLTNFKAPYISKDEIESTARLFRNQYWTGKPFPVDVLYIAEQQLRLDIDPIKNLGTKTSVHAIISKDFKTISVDWDLYMDERFENRMRFSVAHELGHYVMHGDVYREFVYSSIEEWSNLITSIPDREYSFIEYHANEFAGHLLVPTDSLLTSLRLHKSEIDSVISAYPQIDVSMLVNYISSNVCKEFGVSNNVIYKRIEREEIDVLKL